jgi:hypothetical protein
MMEWQFEESMGSWYQFYRRQVPSKDAEDIKTLKELGEE